MKKILALMLSVLLLGTLMPTGAVFAAVPSELNFSILETDKEGHATGRYLKEDFESTDSTHFTTDGKYPAKNVGDYLNTATGLTTETSVSQIFSTAKQFAASLFTEADGNKALKIEPVAAGDITVQGWNVPLSANEMMITEFDFKLTQLPTDLKQINEKGKGSNTSGKHQRITILGMNDMGSASAINMFNGETLKFGESAGNSASIDAQTWYTVREERYYKPENASGEAGTSSEYIYRKVMILDQNGNIIKEFTKNAELTSGTRDYLYHGANSVDFYKSNKMRPHFITVPALTTDGTNLINDNQIEMLVDNFEVTTYKMASYTPSLKSSSIASGATGVASTTNSIEVVFDKPAIAPASATLVCSANAANNKTCTVTASTTKLNTYTIAWEGDLALASTYTLSLGGFTNADGTAATDSISFKTVQPSIEAAKTFDGFENGGFYTNSFVNGYQGEHTFLLSGGTTGRGGAFDDTENTYSGSHALKLSADQELTNVSALMTKDEDIVVNSNKKLVFTYRMNILSTTVVTDNDDGTYSGGSYGRIGQPNDGSNATMCAVIDLDSRTGKHFIGVKNDETYGASAAGSKGYYFDEDKWYNITWVIDADKQYMYIADATTGELVYSNNIARTNSDTAYRWQLVYFDSIKKSANDGLNIAIDDVTMWSLDSSYDTHKLAVANGTFADNTAVNKDADKLTVKFNQPVVPMGEDLRIVPDVDYTVSEKAPKVIYKDFDTIELDISCLDYASSYLLNLGNVKSAAGMPMADISKTIAFKSNSDTKYDINILGDITGLVTVSGAVSADTELKFAVQNNGAQRDIKLFAAVYAGNKLLGIENGHTTLSAGRNLNVTIDFTKAYEGANEIKLFAWDSFTTLKPLTEVSALQIVAE